MADVRKKAKLAKNTNYDRWSDNGGAVKAVGTPSKYTNKTKKGAK